MRASRTPSSNSTKRDRDDDCVRHDDLMSTAAEWRLSNGGRCTMTVHLQLPKHLAAFVIANCSAV